MDKVEPAPADHLQISEIGLPQLVGCAGLVFERLGRLDHDEGWAGDQVMRLQQAVDRGLGDEVALAIGEAHGQLARRQRRLLDRQLDDALAHVIGDAVPDAVRPRRAIGQRLRPAATVSVVPAVKGCPRNAELGQGTAHRQRRLFDQPDDLQLLGSGVSHASSSPTPIVLFLSSRFSSSGQSPHGDTAQRCCPRRAAPTARCGSSPPP